jgi:membrane protein DedA with SNARE-associated domain
LDGATILLPAEVPDKTIAALMDSFATEILAFIKTNPGWASFAIGLTAFGESFVFLSLLFPGTAILIATGALISEGLLDPFLPAVAGIMGAVLGDAISFWIGRKSGPLLPTLWPFRANPQRLTHGIRFFARYGGTSVFIGRFFGPLRAMVPVSAGMMNMPTGRFYVANLLSAMIWAPGLIYLGDRLSSILGPGGLATKVFYIALAAALFTVLGSWIRQLLMR